jgi:GxxExxY protein
MALSGSKSLYIYRIEMPPKAGLVHFNKDTALRLEKFPKIVDYVLNEEGIELYNKILECAKKVYTTLGDCYKEEVYTQALAMEIRDLGYSVETDVDCDVIYRDCVVGKVRADLIANGEDSFIIQAKRLDIYRSVMQVLGCMKSKNINIGYTIGLQKKGVILYLLLETSDKYILYDGISLREMMCI